MMGIQSLIIIKKIIALRKQMDVIVYGSFKMLVFEHPQVFAYERIYKNGKIMVVCNFEGEGTHVSLPLYANFHYILGNYKDTQIGKEMKLRPYECFVIREGNLL